MIKLTSVLSLGGVLSLSSVPIAPGSSTITITSVLALARPFGLASLVVQPQPISSLASDHLAAFLAACSSGPLATDFAESDPEWNPKFHREEVRGEISPPYLVAYYDIEGDPDPPSFDGITVQPQWLRIDVFATTVADSIRLARRVLSYFRYDPHMESTDPIADQLEWQSGKEIERSTDQSDPVPIVPQRGPDGSIVAGSRVRIEFMTQYSIFGKDAWQEYLQ